MTQSSKNGRKTVNKRNNNLKGTINYKITMKSRPLESIPQNSMILFQNITGQITRKPFS